jgi:hypothetical protein
MQKYVLEVNIVRNERKCWYNKTNNHILNYITNSTMPKLDIYDKDKIWLVTKSNYVIVFAIFLPLCINLFNVNTITQLKIFFEVVKQKFHLIYNLKSILINKGKMKWKVVAIKSL